MNLKVLKLKRNELNEIEERKTSNRKILKGPFVFDLSRKRLASKFKDNFSKLIPGIKIRAKDIRMSSLTDERKEHGLTRASSLAHHTNSKMTLRHYIRGAKNL
jgi:hypothetical protein